MKNLLSVSILSLTVLGSAIAFADTMPPAPMTNAVVDKASVPTPDVKKPKKKAKKFGSKKSHKKDSKSDKKGSS